MSSLMLAKNRSGHSTHCIILSSLPDRAFTRSVFFSKPQLIYCHDFFSFCPLWFFPLPFYQKIKYWAHDSPLYIHTYRYEALGLPSIFWQITSADAKFSITGNLNILSVASLQHQAIPQDQCPSTSTGWQVFYFREKLNSHSPSDIFLTLKNEEIEQCI